ncbi:MAG: Holliday junction branch migration protein RuvA [Neisseria sp.]|nr:Holliday junction branch migration protein RuvA [Neisseria sp.]
MIARLSGILIEKLPTAIVVDVNGVGYEVAVSMQTFCELPELNAPLQLHIHMTVREDAQLLFGFGTQGERAAFRQLLKVSGIGAKTALGILSALSEDELAAAIAAEDVRRLSSVPGIGKKTAERMILELRGKLSGGTASLGASTAPNLNDDVINTLLALGYNEREANAACKGLPAFDDVGTGVRLALKNLAK